jgi:hypothetical protein
MSQNPATTAADDFVISLALDQGLLHPAQVEAGARDGAGTFRRS